MILSAVDRYVSSLADFPDALAPWVESVRVLAGMLDGEAKDDPAVWREFRFMFRDLREAAGGSDVSKSIEEEFARLDS